MKDVLKYTHHLSHHRIQLCVQRDQFFLFLNFAIIDIAVDSSIIFFFSALILSAF